MLVAWLPYSLTLNVEGITPRYVTVDKAGGIHRCDNRESYNVMVFMRNTVLWDVTSCGL
jgi:hypothetical protein